MSKTLIGHESLWKKPLTNSLLIATSIATNSIRVKRVHCSLQEFALVSICTRENQRQAIFQAQCLQCCCGCDHNGPNCASIFNSSIMIWIVMAWSFSTMTMINPRSNSGSHPTHRVTLYATAAIAIFGLMGIYLLSSSRSSNRWVFLKALSILSFWHKR